MASINIAVTGCGHGELDAFYRMCEVFERNGKKIDLLIITGDFQAMRMISRRTFTTITRESELRPFSQSMWAETTKPRITTESCITVAGLRRICTTWGAPT